MKKKFEDLHRKFENLEQMTLALRRRKEYESYESPPQRWFGRYDRQAQSTTAASQPRSQPRHDVRPSARRSLEQDFNRSNMTDWDQAPRFTHTTSHDESHRRVNSFQSKEHDMRRNSHGRQVSDGRNVTTYGNQSNEPSPWSRTSTGNLRENDNSHVRFHSKQTV